MAENKNLGIDLELDETVAQGNYSNLAIIAHSTSEFIIDFAAVMPAVPKAKVKSRIILTPEHAKRLLMSLQENIVRYESVHGQIVIPTPQHTGDQFGGKIGEACPSRFPAFRRTASCGAAGPHSLRTGACVVSHCCPQRPPKCGADAFPLGDMGRDETKCGATGDTVAPHIHVRAVCAQARSRMRLASQALSTSISKSDSTFM